MSADDPSWGNVTPLRGERAPGPPLQPPGGGGTFDGMEARVAALETHVEYLRRDVSDIKADLNGMRRDSATGLSSLREETHNLSEGLAVHKERVAHLPSKGFIVTAITTALAIITGLVTFAPKFQALLGLLPPK